MNVPLPVLWSFRRCPYAIRARLAIDVAEIMVEHREILLRDKPAAFLDASPSATVPALVDAQLKLDESYDIMLWALARNDPENWLDVPPAAHDLIATTDADFKTALDRYKYHSRIPDSTPEADRARASEYLYGLEQMLADQRYLFGANISIADMAILPFVRQFAHVNIDWFAAQPWPYLAAWLNEFKASKRFQSIMVKHPLWQPDRVKSS